jgi:maltose alpha-D-glucosyltransferase/alpha-amylase
MSEDWYREAVLYVVDVRSFYDSNADGVGDFRGLTEKLGYIVDLGATALVLLPFYATAGRSGGFDVVDHQVLDPNTGDARDFRLFVRTAHQHGLRVLADFVLGYTSNQHGWFQRARLRAAKPSDRGFYVWRPHDPAAEPPAESEWAWERSAGAYYRHAGASHEPLLDLGNRRVVKALVSAMVYWLRKGVDGFRLHTPTYLGTSGEAFAEALSPDGPWWTELRGAIYSTHPHAVLLATVDGWPNDLRVPLASGNACTLASNSALPLRIFLSMHMGDRSPIMDIIQQTPAIPPACQWALFLPQESGLSLVGLNPAERDYLVSVAAPKARDQQGLMVRRRLAPLLEGDPARIRLAFSLLFSLPGTPGLYYGDEIQMGSNPYLPGNEGLCTPMQWTPDRNGGFSSAEPGTLQRPANLDSQYGYAATSVKVQMGNSASLYWWFRRALDIRKRNPVLARGTIEFVPTLSHKCLAYVRRFGEELVLGVANFSRFSEQAVLDLSTWHGMRPVEVWSRSEYPVIGTEPYSLNLPPFGFSWFNLVGAVIFRSCFISYSSKDHEFANRLYDDLRSREVPCWIAARDLGAGNYFRATIEERIRSSERVIVICSDNSFRSDEVALEVAMAREKEIRRAGGQKPSDDTIVLLPIRIDGAFQHTDLPWFTELRNSRHIADFEQWRDSAAYDNALRRLIRDLARPE